MENTEAIIRYLISIFLFPFNDTKRKKFRRKKTEKWYITGVIDIPGAGARAPPEIEEKKKISTATRITNIIEIPLFFSSHRIIKSRPDAY